MYINITKAQFIIQLVNHPHSAFCELFSSRYGLIPNIEIGNINDQLLFNYLMLVFDVG